MARARDPRAVSLQGRRAGFATRLIADGIDFAVVATIELSILLFLSFARYLIAGGSLAVWRPGGGVTGGAGFAVTTLYLAFGWATTGRTLGKQLAGLRVVAVRGRRWHSGRMLVRAALCVAFPWGLLWVLVSRRNASLQDLVLGTAVIYDWPSGAADAAVTESGGEVQLTA